MNMIVSHKTSTTTPEKTAHPPHERSYRRLNGSKIRLKNHAELVDIQRLLPSATAAIGELASQEAVLRVASKNADSVWLFGRHDQQPEGFQAWLLLNEEGRDRLYSGQLDLHNPPDECIVTQGETPALLYVWATYTPGLTALAIELVVDHFSSPRYRHVDMVSWAAGIRGERSLQRFGFSKGVTWKGRDIPHFWILRRSPQSLSEVRPRYDRYQKGIVPTGVTVVHGLDQLMKVAAVRSAVYMAGQNCPFDEEFDGNDLAATHLLAYRDDQPAGCMRVRFFGDFAKLERLAVLTAYRRSDTAFELVRAAVDLCRAKGVKNLYGHARLDLLPFWQRFGFKLKQDAKPFVFSGETYIEMYDEGRDASDVVGVDSGPYVTIRPEGQWHREGILERSALRGTGEQKCG